MPIQIHNRVLRQYVSDTRNLNTSKFLELADQMLADDASKPLLNCAVNLTFENKTISGDLTEVRSLITQIGDNEVPHSFSISININSNPRKTVTVSVAFSQNLVTFNANNFEPEQSKKLLEYFEKLFPKDIEFTKAEKKSTALDIPQKTIKDQFGYLPGAFKPIPIPSVSDKDVFVIMSFDSIHRDAFFVAIEPTLRKLGFNPIRVDQIQHNSTVTAEIVRQIEAAVFVVADLTGERPNVYYEVGYAHRADKEVILVSKKGSAVHFDVAAINRIEYEDFTNLIDALEKRVRAIADRLGLPYINSNVS